MRYITNIYKLLLVTFCCALSLWACKEQEEDFDGFIQVKNEDVHWSLSTDSLVADSVSVLRLIVDIDPSVHILLSDTFTLSLEPSGYFSNGGSEMNWPIVQSGHHEILIYSNEIGLSQLSINIGNGFNYTEWLHFTPSYPDAMLLKSTDYKVLSQVGTAIDFNIFMNKENGGNISETIPVNVYLVDSLNNIKDELWLKAGQNDVLSGSFTLKDSVYKGHMKIKATVKNGKQELLESIKSIHLE